MKLTAMELICCPLCRAMLSLDVQDGDRIITEGELLCSGCDRRYPVRDEIVHFIDPLELEGPNRRSARYYNRLAFAYSMFSKLALLPFGGERRAREEILEHLDLDGGRTLEVSIGNGVNLPYLFETPDVGEVFGIDISLGQLSHCRRLIDRRGWQVDLFLAMAEALPFRDESFENVLHIGGINFFSDKKQAIDEMIRVARPGAKIVIADEAERLAKRFSRSFETSTSDSGNEDVETAIGNLVPKSMHGIHVEGIWRMHGKYHGYCVEFSKPE